MSADASTAVGSSRWRPRPRRAGRAPPRAEGAAGKGPPKEKVAREKRPTASRSLQTCPTPVSPRARLTGSSPPATATSRGAPLTPSGRSQESACGARRQMPRPRPQRLGEAKPRSRPGCRSVMLAPPQNVAAMKQRIVQAARGRPQVLTMGSTRGKDASSGENFRNWPHRPRQWCDDRCQAARRHHRHRRGLRRDPRAVADRASRCATMPVM